MTDSLLPRCHRCVLELGGQSPVVIFKGFRVRMIRLSPWVTAPLQQCDSRGSGGESLN